MESVIVECGVVQNGVECGVVQNGVVESRVE